jgi:hypothetical protein
MVQNTPAQKAISNILTHGSMNDKNKQILEQYSSRKQTTEEIDELAEAANDGSYRALVTYREKKGGARFHLINRKGHIFGCGYAYLLGWFSASRNVDNLHNDTSFHPVRR